MISGIFSITAICCSPVIRWVYHHYVLAVEVMNFAKITSQFQYNSCFLHDVMVPENDLLEAGQCSWCIFVGNFELRF